MVDIAAVLHGWHEGHAGHTAQLTRRAYSMYANPLDRLVFLSEMMRTSSTLPAVEKNWKRSFSSALRLRL